jgi:hypothetical protein
MLRTKKAGTEIILTSQVVSSELANTRHNITGIYFLGTIHCPVPFQTTMFQGMALPPSSGETYSVGSIRSS